MRVLIVEDSEALAHTIRDLLEQENFQSDIVGNGIDGFDYASSGEYDAIILDIMLPGMNGFELLQKLRRNNVTTPVLVLTAKGELEDRLTGLNLGADYYLTKPFDNKELIACLRAILRRQPLYVSDSLTFGDLELNISLSRLICKGKEIPLNSKELSLMQLLMQNTSIILSKDLLIEKVWGYDSDATYNNVEAYISFLRKKLHLLHSSVCISSVRKLGYRLEVSQ